MRLDFKTIALLGLTLFVCGFKVAAVDQPPRPFFEYKGDFGEEVSALKAKFQEAFGYHLVDFGESWVPREIKMLHGAFALLPHNFYRLQGIEALYRLSRFQTDSKTLAVGEIPAAALPSFGMIYKQAASSYQVFVNDQDPRVEFYNPLFYEEKKSFINIVHHEMAHAFDLVNGFLSFSDEWIALTKFKTLHMPALDAVASSDFLYTLLNDPEVDNYAPVSVRHMPTYSRQNIQEDFANSVAAYIHYPYFRFSHPARFRFLKDKVFDGREYFMFADAGAKFQDSVIADFDKAVAAKEWQMVRVIFVELSRSRFPESEALLVRRLQNILQSDPEAERDLQLGLASCYLNDPGALEFRKDLIRKQRVAIKALLKEERCSRKGRDNFEKNLARWALANIYFYRENGRAVVQFLDPVHEVGYARGFLTRYFWRVFVEGGDDKPLLEGVHVVTALGNGTVKIDLAKSAGGKAVLPEGRLLIMELGARRSHPRTFKTVETQIARIRFAIPPGFDYIGPQPPHVRVIYPFRPAYKHRQ